MTRSLVLCACLMVLSGCARVSASLRGAGSETDDLAWWLSQHPLAVSENLRVEELERTGEASHHLVQIRDREALHVHERHDLDIMIRRGFGTLIIGADEQLLEPGQVVSIPRGTPHAFLNRSAHPAVVFVVFSPPFDGTDSVELH